MNRLFVRSPGFSPPARRWQSLGASDRDSATEVTAHEALRRVCSRCGMRMPGTLKP